MSKQKVLHLAIEDFLSLVVGFIADDLKIYRHLHYLSLSGVDTSPLRPQIHEGVFRLVGLEKDEITEEIEEWYFRQAERVLSIDLSNDNKALIELSAEIFVRLNQLSGQRGRVAS